MKKSITFVLAIIFLTSLASAYSINIETSKETFEAGEPITFKATLLDQDNKPVEDEILVIIEDAEERIAIEKTISSNQLISIDLGKEASYGRGTITATYKDMESKGFFEVGINEEANFKIEENVLTITNIGNTKYTKTVQIIIGQTTGNKYPKLNVGESVSYRLIAPDGVYNLKISDGKTTIEEEEVKLTGTGKVIGVLEDTASKRSPVTGSVRPDKEDEMGIVGYMKNNKFTYVFIFVIFGATILLAVERRFKKKISK